MGTTSYWTKSISSVSSSVTSISSLPFSLCSELENECSDCCISTLSQSPTDKLDSIQSSASMISSELDNDESDSISLSITCFCFDFFFFFFFDFLLFSSSFCSIVSICLLRTFCVKSNCLFCEPLFLRFFL